MFLALYWKNPALPASTRDPSGTKEAN